MRLLCSRAPPGGECKEALASQPHVYVAFLLEMRGIQKDKLESCEKPYPSSTTAVLGVHELWSQIGLRRGDKKSNVWTVFVS